MGGPVVGEKRKLEDNGPAGGYPPVQAAQAAPAQCSPPPGQPQPGNAGQSPPPGAPSLLAFSCSCGRSLGDKPEILAYLGYIFLSLS